MDTYLLLLHLNLIVLLKNGTWKLITTKLDYPLNLFSSTNCAQMETVNVMTEIHEKIGFLKTNC